MSDHASQKDRVTPAALVRAIEEKFNDGAIALIAGALLLRLTCRAGSSITQVSPTPHLDCYLLVAHGQAAGYLEAGVKALLEGAVKEGLATIGGEWVRTETAGDRPGKRT